MAYAVSSLLAPVGRCAASFGAGFTLDTWAHVTTSDQKAAVNTMGKLLSGSV